ncbi:hypothetical protein KM043_011689 [Ampulex compressa]|nr:hypothetical protein KM043_011689 [Ampulex compressa]
MANTLRIKCILSPMAPMPGHRGDYPASYTDASLPPRAPPSPKRRSNFADDPDQAIGGPSMSSAERGRGRWWVWLADHFSGTFGWAVYVLGRGEGEEDIRLVS